MSRRHRHGEKPLPLPSGLIIPIGELTAILVSMRSVSNATPEKPTGGWSRWQAMTISETATSSAPQQGHASIEVLIAEDDPMFRKILQSRLESWGYHVTVAEDGTQAWSILQKSHPPELLIIDWVMPGIDGMELCRRIRSRQGASYQYILVVTAKDDRQDIVRGLEAGADDYLTKPFDKGELRARLRVGTRILTLQEDLINAREDLRFQATHDVLTGIWNRRALWICCIVKSSVRPAPTALRAF